MIRKWINERKDNYRLLKKEVDKIGQRYETMSYEELKKCDAMAAETVIQEKRLTFSINIFTIKENGDLGLCIDADGLPTLFASPSYQFYKCQDGKVYYKEITYYDQTPHNPINPPHSHSKLCPNLHRRACS